ncbi:uncharacterized protein N7503_006681 [Penicillium pulvis]|nr:uncharacterized protein N7503_006681 [Penicillium pulvis]KAJ5797385.1 hypothetical protein N7503_006681 [Penicillium pulvis]
MPKKTYSNTLRDPSAGVILNLPILAMNAEPAGSNRAGIVTGNVHL